MTLVGHLSFIARAATSPSTTSAQTQLYEYAEHLVSTRTIFSCRTILPLHVFYFLSPFAHFIWCLVQANKTITYPCSSMLLPLSGASSSGFPTCSGGRWLSDMKLEKSVILPRWVVDDAHIYLHVGARGKGRKKKAVKSGFPLLVSLPVSHIFPIPHPIMPSYTH